MTRTDVISVCGVWEDAIHQTSPLLPTDFSAGAQSRGWEETFERRLKLGSLNAEAPHGEIFFMFSWVNDAMDRFWSQIRNHPSKRTNCFVSTAWLVLNSLGIYEVFLIKILQNRLSLKHKRRIKCFLVEKQTKKKIVLTFLITYRLCIKLVSDDISPADWLVQWSRTVSDSSSSSSSS